MKAYSELNREELLALKSQLEAEYQDIKAKGLSLDMSRGKPSVEQLDLAEKMLGIITDNEDVKAENGLDCRNYGAPIGLPEARKLLGDIAGVSADRVILGGNSSLQLMFDTVSRSYSHGVLRSIPWSKLDCVKFLCPVPGYDRHFAVTEYFGVEMINIPMTEDGPDMDLVEKLVSEDPAVKGIWCVPKYSNPQGYVYSDETVRRMASLDPAAEDFRIYWDNAYGIHHLYEEAEKQAQIPDILTECEKAQKPDMVYEFISTSKVSFAGGGISAIISSDANLEQIKEYMSFQTIGNDKLNQLRHVKYFKSLDGVKAHMKKEADILRPKFEAVESILEESLGGLGIGNWTRPLGGYFISFDAMPGCAKEIVVKAKEAGLVLTGAGATYPYGKDPKDSNIRIAPTCPTLSELILAAKVFAVSVKLISAEHLLREM